MWTDNETDIDFLNFSGVAETVAEIIVQAHGRPLSIGVSGDWGVGKSSMIKLIRKELGEREGSEAAFVFVDFNAWLYQGYDDARAALMDVIGTVLEHEAAKRQTGLEKTKEFLKRVKWFRIVKLAGTAISVAAGLPPVSLIGDVAQIGRDLIGAQDASEGVEKIEDAAAKIGEAGKGLLKPHVSPSPPKEIHALRDAFKEALNEMGITLVVLIDDLDRCLPETMISTLEAIRLFLFLPNTAFVIAADDRMIKYAVRRHFHGIEEEDKDLATSYFDKLVQIPIRVPPLGTQEVRAYMLLLFIENSSLAAEAKERIRKKVCEQLGKTWQGKRVDRAYVESLGEQLPADLVGRLESADRLASIMTSATKIAGNPRLIKRFLNALAIRMTISKAHGVGVDEAALAKMLLFERCADSKAYDELIKAVSENEQGIPRFLAKLEADSRSTEEGKEAPPWDDEFIKEWLALPPRLGDHDLRGILYVSREHAPIVSPEDRLSSEGIGLLEALTTHPDMAASVKERLRGLVRADLTFIMGRLLDLAQKEQEWGVPSILDACLTVADVDTTQGSRIAAFLSERPLSQIKPSIVPKVADRPWAGPVLGKWTNSDVDRSVKAAIKKHKQS